MSASRPREPVAKADTAWLHMDDAANLMVVTVVLMFERSIPFDEFKQLIETRLLRLPRFRQRIVEEAQSGFGNGRSHATSTVERPHFIPLVAPYWEDDPHFDIDRHFEQAELDDPSDEAALHRLVSCALSRPLDPSRPLWHFYFVPRYREGSAIVARIHHCIGDGLGLIHALLSMADNPSASSASMADSPHSKGSLSRVAALAHTVAGSALALARLVLMKPDCPTSLKGPLAVEKRATWSNPFPVEEVKAVSRRLGGSINDILLTAVTGALRRYLLSDTTVDHNLHVRSVVPVNLRRPADAHRLGNRFGLLFVPMPVGVADPAERLVEIGRRTRALKRSLEPVATFQILRALGRAPRPLFDFIVSIFGRKATAIVTNVIGPREAVTYGGVRLGQAMFWVPCAGNLGLGISILSYAGRVSVGFASDARLVPDPETLVSGFECELTQLVERAQAAV